MHNRLIPNPWSITNLKISKILVHQEFEDILLHDIALMKLKVIDLKHRNLKIFFKNNILSKTSLKVDTIYNKIVPICIPNHSNSFQNKTGYATGWGNG